MSKQFVFGGPDGKEHVIEGPDDATQDQALEQLKKQFPQAPQAPEPEESRVWQFVRGAGRGAAGVIQSASEILPKTFDTLPGLPKKAIEAREKAKGELRQFTDAPSKSGYETAGRLTGSIAPALLIPGMGATSALGSVAERAVIGGVAGGLQPTSEHTAASHLPGAAAGAVTGGAGRVIFGPVADAIQRHGLHSPIARAMVSATIEPAVATVLEDFGISKGKAHAISLGIAGVLFGATGGPMSTVGGGAARLGSAGAGAAAEKLNEANKPRSSESR